MPIRIQRKRVKGWRLPGNAVSVTRPGKWGNPFKIADYIEKYGEQAGSTQCLLDYLVWLNKQIESGELDIEELRGKDLACFCKQGNPCHANILLRRANQ